MNNGAKNAVLWAVIIMAALLLWQMAHPRPSDQRIPEIDYSRFMSEVDAGAVARVDIAGTRIRGTHRDGKGQFRLIGPTTRQQGRRNSFFAMQAMGRMFWDLGNR
jgi:ATP-dependent Zn protease